LDNAKEVGAADDAEHFPVLDHRKPLDAVDLQSLSDILNGSAGRDADKGRHDIEDGTLPVWAEDVAQSDAVGEKGEPPRAPDIVRSASQRSPSLAMPIATPESLITGTALTPSWSIKRATS
jgi:hypothetical protein